MRWRRRKKNRRVTSGRNPVRALSWQLDPRLRRILWLTALVVVGLGLGWQIQDRLRDMSSLTLRQVRVESRFEHLNRAAVRHLIAPYAGQHFFDLDVAEIKQVLQQQPWVREATVRRQWPDGLAIKLIEQIPVARWDDHGLVNSEGSLFFPRADLPADLPRLDGVEHSEQLLLARLHDAGALLQPLGLEIAAISLDERRSWRIELRNGLQLMLGRAQDMQRIQRFVTFYPTLVAARVAEVAVVDLRYPNGIVLRWRTPPVTDVQVG